MQHGESKKEEFQRYLEKSGVSDNLTKVLVGLYELPEKPVNAVEFIKEYLGAAVKEDTDRLKRIVEEQAQKLKDKDDEIMNLKQQVCVTIVLTTSNDSKSG